LRTTTVRLSVAVEGEVTTIVTLWNCGVVALFAGHGAAVGVTD